MLVLEINEPNSDWLRFCVTDIVKQLVSADAIFRGREMTAENTSAFAGSLYTGDKSIDFDRTYQLDRSPPFKGAR